MKCDSLDVEEISKIVNDGGVIVFPTDTVYGIGCNPYNSDAIKKIYEIKNRQSSKYLPVLGESKETLEKIAVFNLIAHKIAEKFWPGPLTLILQIKDDKIKTSLNLEEKIAVRVPSNKCTLAILESCKLLVGTSANLSGTKSMTDPRNIEKNISNYDLLIDGGKITSKGESTIIEVTENGFNVIREGAISKQEIESIF